MKQSNYNWVVECNGDTVIYNGYSGAISRIEKIYTEYIEKIMAAENIDNALEDQYQTINKALIDNGYIIEDNFDEIYIMEQIYKVRKYSSEINHITVIPTYDCNFACEYCFERNREKTNSAELIQDEVVKQIVQIAEKSTNKSFKLTFFGGEPLLVYKKCLQISSEVKKVVEKREAKYSAFIVTNGYLLTENIAKQLSRVGITHAQVTIDGDKSTHNRQRKGCS